MYTSWKFLAVVAVALAIQAADSTVQAARAGNLKDIDGSDLATVVETISETIRGIMKTGSESLQIPVLDPVHVSSNLNVDINLWPLSVQVEARDFKVSGASEFQLTKISQVAGTSKVSVEFYVPVIHISCNYDLNGKAGFSFLSTSFLEKAFLTSKMVNVRGVATGELVTKGDGQLALNGLEINSWAYDNSENEIEDIRDSGIVARAANYIVTKFSSYLVVEPHATDLSAWVSASGEKIISHFLDAIAGRLTIADLDKKAAQLLKQLSEVMKTGSEKLSVPLLDPIEYDVISVPHINSKGINVDLTLSDIVVSGTSNYIIQQISQREGTNELTVELEVPAIKATGSFVTKGKVFLLPFSDDGYVYIDITGLKVTATAALAPTIDGAIALTSLKIDSWSIKSIEEEFQNLESFSPIGTYFGYVLNRAIPSAVETARDQINGWAETAAKAVVSNFLAGLAASPKTPTTIQIASVSDEVTGIIRQLFAEAVPAPSA